MVLKVINFVDYSLNQGAPAGHKSAETPIGHESDPRSNKIGHIKFCEACTKFCEGCTKGFKVRSEVWIGPQLLCYGFLNLIMDHPCSDGSPGSNMIECTKFCE